MKIIYLGWGSLIWNLEKLPVKGNWIKSDLKLPLEYSRKSQDGRLTLVIDKNNGQLNNIWYILSKETNLNKAINALKIREKTSLDNIGYISYQNKFRSKLNNDLNEKILKWMIKNQFQAVIWTDLQNNWNFTNKSAFNYFNQQSDEIKLKIFEYIFKSYRINDIETEFSDYFLKKIM